MSSGEEDEEEPYPPWLAVVLDEDSTYWDEVTVLQAASNPATITDAEGTQWVEVKEILAPDTAEAAAGKAGSTCRTYRVKRHTTILIAAGPLEPPYVGLVDKLFRKKDAKHTKLVDGKPVYKLSDFGVHAFWFYRPREVPKAAWRTHKRLRGHIEGRAICRLTPKSKPFTEQFSEKQVLFSSHHTLHDYPQDQGILSLDCFLQACQVHWVGGSADPPTRYEVHGSSLTAVQEPGFVVRGFLWCASKSQPQLDPELKVVHKLEGGKWPDQETRAIVSTMCEEHKKQAAAFMKRNQAVLQRFHDAQSAKKQSIPSDTEEDGPAAAAAAAGGAGSRGARPGSVQLPVSPRLGGLGEEGGGGEGSDSF